MAACPTAPFRGASRKSERNDASWERGLNERRDANTVRAVKRARARKAEANKQSEHEKSKSRSHEQSGAAQPYHPPTISTMSASSPPNLASM